MNEQVVYDRSNAWEALTADPVSSSAPPAEPGGWRRLATVKAIVQVMAAAGAIAALVWLAASSAVVRESRLSGGGVEAQAEARAMLEGIAGENLLLLDLASLRAQFRKLPGVSDARLSRILPDVLAVSLSARRPLANWGHAGSGWLVDAQGERYRGSAPSSLLPVFSAPPGPAPEHDAARAAVMADFYADANAALAEAGTSIAQIAVDRGGEWRVFLDSGTVLYLGRDSRLSRVRRFARHAPALLRRFEALRVIDLRYDRGFAIVGGVGS